MWGAIAAGIASLFGGYLAASQNRKNAREANEANRQMNEANKTYNDPANQKSRLASAGLNPDLMYQNGAAGLVNTQVPNMQQAAPMDNPLTSFANLELMQAQKDNIEAQTRNIESNTSNTNADTQTKLTYNEFQRALLRNEVQIGGVNIDLGESTKQLNQAERQQIYQNIVESDQRIQESKERIENLRSQTNLTDKQAAIADIDRQWHSQKVQAEIAKMYSSAALDQNTINVANATLPYMIYGMEVDADMKKSIASLNDQQRQNLGVVMAGLHLDNEMKEVGIERAKFDLKMDKRFGNLERGVGLAVKTSELFVNQTQTAKNLVGCLVPFM